MAALVKAVSHRPYAFFPNVTRYQAFSAPLRIDILDIHAWGNAHCLQTAHLAQNTCLELTKMSSI
jgi:hypothetical protein